MLKPLRLAAVVLLMVWGCASAATRPGRVVEVNDPPSLRQALADARPGDVIRLASGRYGAFSFAGPHGTKEAPIVIESSNVADPAIFGGRSGIHLSGPRHVILRHVVVRGSQTNGVNIDDAGRRDGLSQGIVIENVRVEDVGPVGNLDGIKLSGLDEFRVSGCTVVGWGGSAVDMVGCHDGLIERCVFRGKDGFSQHSGAQIKGGCRGVTVRDCLFVNPGGRGVNLGGSTGRDFFRPPLEKFGPEAYEASGCVVEGSTFIGGESAVAFVSQTDCVARFNTIYRPGRFAFRILQESMGAPFVPCRRGTIEANLIVWRSDQMRTAVNVGPNTQAESFVFKSNAWFCEDRPGQSRLPLPAKEEGGVYGVDPKFTNAADEDLKVSETKLAGRAGAGALPKTPGDGQGR